MKKSLLPKFALLSGGGSPDIAFSPLPWLHDRLRQTLTYRNTPPQLPDTCNLTFSTATTNPATATPIAEETSTITATTAAAAAVRGFRGRDPITVAITVVVHGAGGGRGRGGGGGKR